MFRDKPLISVWGVPVGAAKLVPCNPSRGRPLSESQKRRTRGRKEREKRKEKKEIPRRFAGAQYIISQEARLAKKSPPPLFSRSLASPPLATPRHPSPPLASPTLASPPLRATPPRHPSSAPGNATRRDRAAPSSPPLAPIRSPVFVDPRTAERGAFPSCSRVWLLLLASFACSQTWNAPRTRYYYKCNLT
jgi:hypothetical protein